MLMDWQFQKVKREARDCRERLKARRTDLAALQQPLKEAKLPVIVLVEGWGAAGKGSVIHSLIRELDPRFFLELQGGIYVPYLDAINQDLSLREELDKE